MDISMCCLLELSDVPRKEVIEEYDGAVRRGTHVLKAYVVSYWVNFNLTLTIDTICQYHDPQALQ